METPQAIATKPREVRCPRCLRNDIVQSMPRGIADMFMEGLGRVPRHCRSCGKRFYIGRPGSSGDAASTK